MKKSIILPIVAVLFSNSLTAQVNFSIAAGGLNYQGEIGSSASNNYSNVMADVKSLKPILQGRIGFYVSPSTQLSIESGIAKFEANDLHSANASIRNRDYSVSGNLIDFGVNIHHFIFPGLRLYAIAGVKGVVSKSSVMKASEQYITQDFRNFSLLIPLGVGIELGSIGRGLLKFEWTTNTVLNDKLDGLNYAYSKYDDVYSTALLVYSMPLSKSRYRNHLQHRESRKSYRSFGMKHGQCPQF